MRPLRDLVEVRLFLDAYVDSLLDCALPRQLVRIPS